MTRLWGEGGGAGAVGLQVWALGYLAASQQSAVNRPVSRLPAVPPTQVHSVCRRGFSSLLVHVRCAVYYAGPMLHVGAWLKPFTMQLCSQVGYFHANAANMSTLEHTHTPSATLHNFFLCRHKAALPVPLCIECWNEVQSEVLGAWVQSPSTGHNTCPSPFQPSCTFPPTPPHTWPSPSSPPLSLSHTQYVEFSYVSKHEN
eukprot:363151-Chlamydomonas_euryale.AAC.1